MNTCLILYLSSTAAQEAAAILRAHRIPAETAKPPAGLTGGSCSYALTFPSRYLPAVRRLISTGGGLYSRNTDGIWRRIP